MSVRSLAALPAAALLLLAGCAAAPTTGDDGAASTSDFVPCLVSTTGGFDDLSFNQFTLEGMQEAAAELIDVPFSTYRRHLHTAIERVTATLWRKELGE